MADRIGEELKPGEIALLIDGLSDDVSFDWALIHLGIRENTPIEDAPPSASMIADAFEHIRRLVGLGLVSVGRIEYSDRHRPPGSLGRVRHVAESETMVRQRVEDACAAAAKNADWAFSCWLVNTDEGDAIAKRALESR